jgi:hypothetical protein
MSEQKNAFDIFDPTGLLKSMRGDSMEAWAKTMVQLVNSEAYADATGKMLDAWLTTSAPMRKLIDSAMTQSLASLKMPSRDDVLRLAERLTNIEMRLDDLDAKLDDVLRAVRPSPATG